MHAEIEFDVDADVTSSVASSGGHVVDRAFGIKRNNDADIAWKPRKTRRTDSTNGGIRNEYVVRHARHDLRLEGRGARNAYGAERELP
jgi:hypothetical protein